MHARTSPILALLALPALGSADLAAQVRYHLVPLPFIQSDGGSSAAVGISPDGSVVVGSTRVKSFGRAATVRGRACCWVDGQPHLLPRLPVPSSGINNSATRVNARGVIAGDLSYGEELFATHATLWRGGAALDLGTLPGDGHSMVSGLNDHDVVVGLSAPVFFFFGGNRAFRWENGSMTELPPLLGSPEATAAGINNAGTVVGASGDFWGFPFTSATPVVWQGGAAQALALPAGAPHGQALVINDAGVIGGIAGIFESLFFSGGSRPCRWDAGVPSYLPLPAGDNTGLVMGINAAGDMVGTSGFFEFFRQREEPVLWTGGAVHRLRDITTAPAGWDWNFGGAAQITDRGEIAGYGALDGSLTAFLAVPIR